MLFASEMIDSVSDGRIFGIINNTRVYRKSFELDNLPKGYQLSLKDDSIHGSMNYCESIAGEFRLLNNSDTVLIIADRYDESIRYPAAPQSGSYRVDTLFIPLNELKINLKLHKVSRKYVDDMGYVIWDEMYLRDSMMMHSFYLNVYKMLKKN